MAESAAVHGHIRPEGGDALREVPVRGLAEPQDPVVKRGAYRLEEPRVLAVAEGARLPHR